MRFLNASSSFVSIFISSSQSFPSHLKLVIPQVPDKYFFPATFRSRHSIYGFAPPIEDDPVASLPAHARNESEGWTWHTPPMQYRLVNRRWAAIAAQVTLPFAPQFPMAYHLPLGTDASQIVF